MSEAELKALVELLNRLPMTAAERLWLQGLVERLQPKKESATEAAE